MKRAFTSLTVLILLLLTSISLQAQVKIGQNPNVINKGSILEMEADSLGVLFPRVNIADTANWSLKGDSVAGMFVYNTNTTTGEGFYYWDGGKWISVGEGSTSSPWYKSGTTNPAQLNTDSMYVMGNVGVGVTAPTEKLDVDGNIKTSGSLQLGTTGGINPNDPCTPAEAGKIIFNGTNFCGCDGNTWKQMDN